MDLSFFFFFFFFEMMAFVTFVSATL
jgi:hypothetical protein